MKIEDVIQQKQFESEYQKLAINLLYTSAWITGYQQRFFKQHNLTMQQYNILRILRGQKGNAITMNDVTCRMIDKMSNTSRIVDKLVSKGWVDRNPGEKDRRQVMVNITASGLQLLDEMDQDVSTMNQDFANISEAEASQLNDLLDKMRTK